MAGPNGQDSERWGSSILALILAFAAAFRLAQLDGLPPFIDESAALVLGLDYQSWDVWNRLLHGKLLGYLWFKPTLLLAWDPLYAARLLSALTGVVSVPLTYWLLLTFVTRGAALVGAAFLAFVPLVVFHDRLALFDGFMVACVTAALLLYLRPRKGQSLTLMGAGFLFGIALLTKAYALLAILLWLPLLRRQSGRRFRTSLIVGLGFLACLLVVSLFLAGELRGGLHDLSASLEAPERFIAPDLSAGERVALAAQQLGQVFGYLFGYDGWAFLPVILLAALVPGSRQKLRVELLVAWLLSCVILAAGLRFLFSRYLLLTLPQLAFLVSLAFDDCVEKTRTAPRRLLNTGVSVLVLLVICAAEFAYRDSLIAAQLPERVLPARDAYQYLWGGPSGFGIREIANELRKLDLSEDCKIICVTRGMGTGTHGAATLPLLLRHEPIRFMHLWLKTDAEIETVRQLPTGSRVIFFVDDPQFLGDQPRLNPELKLLFEIKGTTGRPDYCLYELVR